MKRRELIAGLVVLAVALACAWAWGAFASSTPTRVQESVGGYDHFVYSMADGVTGNVAEGSSVDSGGLTLHVFVMIGNGGTITVTPRFGTYVYSGDTLVGTAWADGNAVSVTNGLASAAVYPNYPADLVSYKAASCANCDFDVVWVGALR